MTGLRTCACSDHRWPGWSATCSRWTRGDCACCPHETTSREGGAHRAAPTGGRFPGLVGLYLFADFRTGKLWSLDEESPGRWRQVELLDTPLQVSSFGEDEDGELYVTSFHDNRVHRVTLGR